MSYKLLYVTGIFIATMPAIYWLLDNAITIATSKYSGFVTAQTHSKRNLNLPLDSKIIDNTVLIWAAIGALAGVVLTWGTDNILIGAIICSFGQVLALLHFGNTIGENPRCSLSGCLELFRLVETYMQLGMPLQLALAEAKEILVVLKPAVNKALAYWGMGSDNALKVLQKKSTCPKPNRLCYCSVR